MKTTSEKLTHDLHVLVEDGEELLRSGLNRFNERAHDRMTQALNAARTTGSKLKANALKGARSTDEAIRGHPYRSLGLAFGMGMLIGVLLHRR
jgi:ElaB/YqjD/DUF883 family membrane-anchored ribosome-binding protein